MASHNNFAINDRNTDHRYDVNNPEFNSSISSKGLKEVDEFTRNLDKWTDFIVWARWNFDLFLDLITPEEGGIRLDLDQRVFLRCMGRFVSVYGVFPRG